MYTLLLIFLQACLLTFLLQKRFAKLKKLPPGPFRIPGIGSIIQILLLDPVNPANAFHKLGKIYGNVVSVQIGTVFAVVINGQKELKEALASEDCLSHTIFPWLLDRSYGKELGIIFSTDDFWQKTRSHTIKNLRNFGFGVKNSMEPVVATEFAEFLIQFKTTIDSKTGVVNMADIFTAPALNIVWSIVSGSRYSYDDPKLSLLLANMKTFTKSQSFAMGALSAYPFLAQYAPKLVGYDKIKAGNRIAQNIFKDLVRTTREQSDYKLNSSSENLIDLFLKSIDDVNANRTVNDKEVFTDENLELILLDLFLAGAETTANSLNFGILFLMLNPQVQDKVRQEIKDAVGFHQLPTQQDLASMKYTQATVLEILRCSVVVPLAPRKTKKELSIGNHLIPSNTVVYFNYHSAHIDERTWKNPHLFQPERFLDGNGDIINANLLKTFGGGKRGCIGEVPARMMLITFLTGLLQNYKFEVDPSSPMPSTDPHLGLTSSPKPYTAVVKSVLGRRMSRPWEMLG